MAIKKQYFKTKEVCKVSFSIDASEAKGAETASLVGDFNGWNPSAHPMKKLKAGGFSLQIELPKDATYQFRYVLNGSEYINDNEADEYVPAGIGEAQNCVLKL
ncbi:hypothetical protein JCM31826_00480 [Thermaurantimonas aggregans]|uniref:Glycoside hydrolase family 13 N-terminal domain-containing protein n=1 Tax=Thermaurantimonas aggregans TaxID=2173829 RepID=A0A401XHS7_9FLAO|nr:isoamylase early set domain-containing protein [Thermaurantimonas aggregans]MCX8149447.1 isoamylase early set domain-containing protein [Thermaurantimonas aggregans]GCD76566.1 hypothetical protein JCM31826_00480 [Thermaurantimonas aggregans]